MNDMAQMLELMDRPAFFVQDGRVAATNPAARARDIHPGDRAEDLLSSGLEEYRAFTAGTLSLSLRCGYDAAVTILERGHLFALEPGNEEEGRLLCLAAQTLRDPLGNVMALTDNMESSTAAAIRRELYRILRIVGNMTAHPAIRMDMQDVNEVLRELWEKAADLCGNRGVTLTYLGSGHPVYSCIDSQLLERAVLNLLSNSLKYAPAGGKVRLELKSLGKRYQIILRDQGDMRPLTDLFDRCRREPGLGDGREGLGMGLRLVRQAVSAHGGSVLLDHPKEGGLRVTMTLPIRQEAPLHSPRLRLSYTGERDAMLVELSDVLPAQCYEV